jgi:hypothetical protein
MDKGKSYDGLRSASLKPSFSGPTYPRLQIFKTQIRISYYYVLADKVKKEKIISTLMRIIRKLLSIIDPSKRR